MTVKTKPAKSTKPIKATKPIKQVKKVVKKTKVSKSNLNTESKKTEEKTPPPTPTTQIKETTNKPATSVVEVTKPITKPTSVEHTDCLFNNIQAQLIKLSEAGCQLTNIKKGLISLKKSIDKERKEAAKAQPKKRAKSSTSTNRAPSGFAKPCKISKELCIFMELEEEIEIARTAVTRFITSYIKEHNLQDPTNKRRILADESLKKLLNINDDSCELTYFNLQKFLKPHFISSKS